MSNYTSQKSLLCVVIIIWVMKSGTRCLASPNNFYKNSSIMARDYGHNTVHDDDNSSMLVLKDRFANTILGENWTQEAPFCSWMGVTCSRRHPFRVTALNLSYIGLQGTIPEEIGNLSFLSYLHIGSNSFNGPIPDTIWNLYRLRSLNMSDNKLSAQIPHNIGKLRNLELLDLSQNQFVGTIPTSVFNLSSLKEIYLYSNQLSGNILDLGICQHLPQLQYIDLSLNNLSGSIPMHISNLSWLQILFLDGNHLTGGIPNSIGNLTNLEELDVSFNSINGRIPLEIGQLSNLNILSLGGNKLNGELPTSLYNLSKLQVISIPANEIYGELPSSISTSLPNLEQLYIGGNGFTGVIPISISNLSHLTKIDLGYNSVSGYIPINLGNLSNLELLSLSGNKFSNNISIRDQDFFTHLGNCKYLNWLEFEYNPEITGEISKSFFSSSNLSTTLEIFIADSCGISGTIPTEISNVASLIKLDIGNNMLEGTIPESVQKLVNLQLLELSDNMLQGSIPESICNMTSLYYLGLSRNKLSGQLPLCLGTDLSALREIYLSQNAFNSNIPLTLWINGGIQRIDLSNNFFYDILPRELGNSKSLLELNISGNQLFGNIPDSIGQLQSLVFLSMSNNRLNGSIPDLLSNLKGLEHLDLSQNNLSGPIPKSLTSLAYLQYFNVSFNQLSGEIPNEGPFKNFTAECFTGNKDLCGAASLRVEPCKFVKPRTSRKRRIISRYILPPVLVFSIFIAGTIVFFVIRRRNRKPSDASHLLSDFPSALLHERISYYDILHATKNFDVGNLIGRGSFGSVYKGEFSHAVVAAVKVFNLDIQGALKSFDIECKILCSIRHRNLLKVMTSCSNHDFKALVMEYMCNGNLDKMLHSTECSMNIFQRFGIMADVADALEYLHHGCSTPIIHCDLKPSNILLDNDMVAHVGDFGISKLLTPEAIIQQTKTLGTFGYMAPEYGSGGFISTAVDVYSYGIVVLETFTRKRPTDEMFSEELTMQKWASESFSGSLTQIFDFELLNAYEKNVRDRYDRCLTSIIALALKCIAQLPEERPSMNEVARKIQKLKIDLEVI